ncbi:hypothetical protein Micbo1qcDRAFT_226756 [Microdochium bolleyi]|uniref:Zn(2)-C6 fungal-type domain-containing protein n=1 Tax=Microdochium bolleyi TaxID=196109 RepID=A0A136J165_9PEZI|nr:hypothetical protein Micbo1qcDRAFT_226756 [Microdochium bolleyi]
MSKILEPVVVSTATNPRRPRKQYSCLECQRRKQKCIFKDIETACVNCARRFPPVECVRTGTRAPQERHVKVFQLGSWDELPATGRPPKHKVSISSEPKSSRESSRRQSEDDQSDDSARSWTHSQSGTFTLTVRTKKPFLLDGCGDRSVPSPRFPMLGGILTEIGTTLNAFPLESTKRNTELLHYYLRNVVPNLVSIDGESQPTFWKNNVLHWQLQSPLMPNIGILMAATTCGLERDSTRETLSIKSTVLGYINSYLASSTPETFRAVAVELIKCILSMVVMEWFWGTEESMRAHQRGIKEMLRLCGGISGLADPVAGAIPILTDYELACGFEEDLCWQKGDPSYNAPWPSPTSWPHGFDCPLIAGPSTFLDVQADLGIDACLASILDDVRFLTTSVTTPPTIQHGNGGGGGGGGISIASKIKIQTTASWLHDRLLKMPPATATRKDSDTGSSSSDAEAAAALAETIRLAGLVYSSSIKSLTPFARYPRAQTLSALSDAMLRVPLSRWKKIPGIYLWVLLVLCPSTKPDMRGKYIRRKMATTGLAVGFEDFVFSIACLRACWQVQRWIANGGVAH